MTYTYGEVKKGLCLTYREVGMVRIEVGAKTRG
jgi:hypothetical protein